MLLLTGQALEASSSLPAVGALLWFAGWWVRFGLSAGIRGWRFIILWRPVRVLLLLSAVWCFALVLNLRGPLCCQGPGLPPEPGKTLEKDWGVARRHLGHHAVRFATWW